MPKISHKQKSKKHRSRRTKKYSRKQKGGVIVRQNAVKSGAGVSASISKSLKKRTKAQPNSSAAESNNEEPLPLISIPHHKAVAAPDVAGSNSIYNTVGKSSSVYRPYPGSFSAIYTPTVMGNGNGIYEPYTGMGMGKGSMGKNTEVVAAYDDSLYNVPKGTLARAAAHLPGEPGAPPLPPKEPK